MEGMIIYMLDDVEYPLLKTKLQKMLDHKCEVNEVSSLGEDCWEQNAKAFPLLVIWFPLPEIFPTVSVSLPLPRFPLLEDFPLLIEDKDYLESKTHDTAHGVSTTHSTTHTQVNHQLLLHVTQEDLEHFISDLEELILSLEMAMLTIRARRFIRDWEDAGIKWSKSGFDKSIVGIAFNYHKHGHFVRECRFSRNQEFKRRENNTRTIAVETPTQNALIAQDGIGGYDWSYQAKEEQPTNHALMAFTSSGSSSSSDSEVDSCSKTCVKAYASLKEQYDNLSSDYKKSQFNLVSYKAGLESVEARLAHYKKNETVFEESINVLKLEVRLRDNALNEYKMNLEKAKKDRDQLKQTLEKFQNSSKSLNNILESQVIDKSKTGLGYDAATAASPAVESFVNLTDKSGSDKGYHSVPPPLTGNFIPRKPDLTFMDEIVESENLDVTTVVTPCNVKTVKDKGVSNIVESNVDRMNNTSAPIIEDWNSDDESEIDYTVRPNTEKIKSVKTVRETEAPKQIPRRNQRNWNYLMDRAVVSKNKRKGDNVLRPQHAGFGKPKIVGNPQQKEYKEKGVIDSGCSRHMTGNKCYLTEYEDYDGGFVSFGDGKGRISRKGKIKTGTLDFDNVYFCKELKYNLFSVSQICDKKNNVLFTDTECLVLSSDFKLLDESQVLLRVPRKDNIYSVDLKSVVPTKGLTCLFAKATIDESNLWHRRLGHINFKNMNKLVRGNLVRGLPSKIFENDHSCVACQKGKQHKASCKAKLVNLISKTLHMLHMDLFGPTNVKSLMKKSYCLVVTDDFSRFSWVFFFATKDETSGILKTFITEIEIQLDHKVKVIKCDNETEFKNSVMNQFCEMKGIKMEFSVARTPQQNGVAERRNRTLIEATRTMVLVIKPHNNIPYELIHGRISLIDFMKPFGCPAHMAFDIESLIISMNYVPVVTGNQTNGIVGTRDNIVTGQAEKKTEPEKEYILIPIAQLNPINLSSDHHITVNTTEASNTFEEHLFERFSPFKNAFTLPPVSNVTPMDDTGIFGNAYDDEDVGADADLNNLETTMNVSPIPTTRIDKEFILKTNYGDLIQLLKTRRMTRLLMKTC
ncbi:putative ribonuclease H-like domain-containing protein [Tanacetum coccineum]|uniref:Ribonuclease H-like domain-containing protein n=1 Tax=Tanacetum coccineum TaxID=301880 RepID=A0ABQ5FEB4_9ASTR